MLFTISQGHQVFVGNIIFLEEPLNMTNLLSFDNNSDIKNTWLLFRGITFNTLIIIT